MQIFAFSLKFSLPSCPSKFLLFHKILHFFYCFPTPFFFLHFFQTQKSPLTKTISPIGGRSQFFTFNDFLFVRWPPPSPNSDRLVYLWLRCRSGLPTKCKSQLFAFDVVGLWANLMCLPCSRLQRSQFSSKTENGDKMEVK
jgi:hypothetical protein